MRNTRTLTALLQVLALAVLATVSQPSRATALSLDFNGPGAGAFQYGPYLEDGFRIQSLLVPTALGPAGTAFYQGHYDRECGIATTAPSECGNTTPFAPNYDGTPWLGTDPGSLQYFDANGTLLSAGNDHSLIPRIRIDRSGELFSLLDFVNVRGGYALTSSNGGFIAPSINPANLGQLVFLAGNQWSNISWLELTPITDIGAPVGFDNLNMNIPEPAPLALFALALAGLGAMRRRLVR
jgi:PEP-CTERM motif